MSRLSCVQNCICPDYRAFKIAYVQTIVRSKLHMSRLSCVHFFPDRVILNARRHLVRSFRSGHIDFWPGTSTWVLQSTSTAKNCLEIEAIKFGERRMKDNRIKVGLWYNVTWIEIEDLFLPPPPILYGKFLLQFESRSFFSKMVQFDDEVFKSMGCFKKH